MSTHRLHYYSPAFVSLGLLFFVMSFPRASLTLLMIAIVLFGTVYTVVVYRLLRARDEALRGHQNNWGPEAKHWAKMEPNFRTVTFMMTKRGTWVSTGERDGGPDMDHD